MYKDKDKQREADRARQKRYRAERGRKAYPKGVTDSGRDKAKGVTNLGRDITGVSHTLRCHTTNDKDYPQPDLRPKPKRGKDIKTFADLSSGIQMTINRMSMDANGKIDTTAKANRTSIAISYQHMFPDKYYPQDAVISGPAVIGKPGDADYNGVCTEAWRAERGR